MPTAPQHTHIIVKHAIMCLTTFIITYSWKMLAQVNSTHTHIMKRPKKNNTTPTLLLYYMSDALLFPGQFIIIIPPTGKHILCMHQKSPLRR